MSSTATTVVTDPAPRASWAPSRAEGPAAPPIVVTDGLSKRYAGGVLAVDRLDLTITQGEVFGLLGPNGAGKTTTVGMLTTRILPTAGKALVSGVDVVADPVGAKRLIGVVSQTNTLDRALSVRENLYFHARYFGIGAGQARVAADEALERFRLTERAGHHVDSLSGGLARRLMLARAMLHRPAILFLDEPTAGLDPQTRLALWALIRELDRDGHSVLLTTHYMEEADQLCDRVAVLDRGRVLALDAPSRLKASLGSDTEVVLTAKDRPEELAAYLKRRLGRRRGFAARVVDGRVRLTFRRMQQALPRVVAVAEEGGFAIRDLSIDEPTLETVFISLTGKDLRE